jgi:hypothetical protein
MMHNDSENDVENLTGLAVNRRQSRLSLVYIKQEKIIQEVIYPCADHNT